MIQLLFLFASILGGPATPTDVSICIGNKCTGETVSYAYLQENHLIRSNQTGYTIDSFRITFSTADAIKDVKIKGNDFAPVLPDLKLLKSGSKFYIDEVILTSPEARTLKAASVFVME